jgi:hypothetical protein
VITALSARFTSGSTAIVTGELEDPMGCLETVFAEYEEHDGRWGCARTADRREHQAACDAEFLALLERCAMLAAEAQAEAAE